MGTSNKKNMTIVYILDILRKYSDEDHRLTQTDILTKLEDEYDVSIDRKTVSRNLNTLCDISYVMGYEIEYNETVRKGSKSKSKETVSTSDYYIVPEYEFEDSELRLIIDSMLFSSHIPYNQLKQLVEKLEDLSKGDFESHIKHIHTVPHDLPQNPELFYSIEVLDNAITKGCKVKFTYSEYGTDAKLHKRTDSSGKVREYIISPYQMVARDGKYYLICNHDGYDAISNYRVDRITDIEMLDKERARPFKELEDSDGRKLDLAEYMKEHIHMFTGHATSVTFRANRSLIGDIIDKFGKEVKFTKETDTYVEVLARVTDEAMLQFANNYSPDVVVLKPKRLADRMRENAEKVVEAYS